MAGDISASNIRIGANIQGMLDGLKRGSAAVKTMTYDMNNKLADSYRRAGKEQSVFRGGLMKLGDDLQGIATKMAVIGTLPTLLAAGKAYKDYAELEKLEKGLTRYGETLQTVREIAKLPNIGVFDAAKSLISLKAMKMNGDLATRSIKAFANAITDAGGSAVDLDPALVNLRQFKSTRHINQVDVRQLSARIPQTMDAFQNAFGTQDVEELNKQMKILGTDPFIDKFITELEKIPKAGGGAATAMEQVGDSFLFFSASIGKGIDQSFGVTEKISAIGGMLDNLTTSFTNLTPEAQKSIFAVGAIAVVMPAIIGAVGGLIKLLPILATGFGLISAPIAAAIIVVGIAAAAIITQWDNVKAFLVESTWWNTLVGAAKAGLGIVVETFKVVINFIQGDWSNMGKALVNILKNTVNLVITTVGGMVKGVLGLFGTINNALGFDALGNQLSSWVKGIDKITDKYKFDVPNSIGFTKDALNGLKETLDDTNNTGVDPPVPPVKEIGEAAEAYEEMSEAAFQMWKIDLEGKYAQEQKALKDKIQSYKELVGVVAGLNIEMLKHSKVQDMNFGSVGISNAGFSSAQASDRATSATAGIKIGVPANIKNQIEAATKPINELKNYLNDSGWSNTAIEKFFKRFPQNVGESAEEYAKRMDGVIDVSKSSAAAINNSITQLGSGIATSIGETLGDLASGMDSVGNFGTKILTMLGSTLKDLGKSLVAIGLASEALKEAFKNPAVAIAVGAATIVAGQVVSNAAQKKMNTNVTAFANGGFAHRDMIARVGDNPNARFDPEMIAPYSKVSESINKSVKESIGSNGGGDYKQVGVRIQGSDLLIILEREQRRNSAIRG